jgi:hypothetical protein
MLVYDPIAEHLQSGQRVVIGDAARQAEIDFTSAATTAAVGEYSRGRLQRIYDWQREINLSVLPLSAAEDTLPQIHRLMGRMIRPGNVR